MKKGKMISSVLAILGITMIAVALQVDDSNNSLSKNENIVTNFREIDVKNMAASANMVVSNKEDDSRLNTEDTSTTLMPVSMEVAPASVIVPPRVEVYEKMTIEELSDKLNRNLGSGYISGKGYLIASKCLEKGVDPYVAVAIMLHETGCKFNCSTLVRTCNNVGGQKGSPGCNGGAYKSFATLDDGIVGFIDNLYNNYYSKGLNTIDLIGPRYAESKTWVSKIYSYVNQIRAS